MTDITGYRALTVDEVNLINEVKAAGVALQALADKLRAMPDVDQRWVSMGVSELQVGLMCLTRSVARPTTF